MNYILKLRNKWSSGSIEVKASIVYTICNVLQKCVSLITVPIFTRLLTQAQYGQITIFNSWVGIFGIVITLNLAYGSFSPAMIKFEDKRDEYIASLQGIFLTNALLFFIIYFPFRKFWNAFFDLPTFMVVLMIVEVIAQNTTTLWMGKKRFEFDYKSIAIRTLIVMTLSPILSLILVFLSNEKGYAKIIGNCIVIITMGTFIFISNLIKGKYLFNKAFWKYALGFNIPLLAYYFSQFVFNQSDRLMINHYCGNEKAGIYGVAYQLAMVLSFVLNAINNSYVPWFYRKVRENNETANKSVSLKIAFLMAVLILGIIIMAPEIIYVMAGSKYIEAIWIIPPVAISLLLLFYAQLFINVEFYYEQKGQLVIASIGAAILNVVLNALFIPNISYIAAGYTTLISYIAFAVANYFTMKRIAEKNKFSLEAFNMKGLIVLGIGFILIATICIIRYCIITVVAIIIVCFKNKLLYFIKNLKS